ncbi:MAG TPA: formyltransferase [Holosporales bacterium]|nr:formyltransferase [Holosporales bacterium]
MISPKKILFFGYSQLGYDAFQYLVNHFSVVGAVTHHINKAEPCWFDLVEERAEEYGIPVFKPEISALESFTETVEQLNPDLIISVYYRYMIPMRILDIPQLGSYNMHGSFLPHFRGCAPINWAIVKGAKTSGVTLHEMVEKPDAGAIIAQRSCIIGDNETAGELVEKMRPLSLEILKTAIPKIIDGTQKKTCVDIKKGSYFGRRKPDDGCINPLEQTAQEVHNLVRALQPASQYPSAFLEIDGHKFFVHKTDVSAQPQKESIQNVSIGALYTLNDQEKWLYCKNGTWVKLCDITPMAIL